jgi:DNA repair protein RadA/Sms
MAKPKTSYICLNCQQLFTTWSGRCSNCNEWNTIVEQEQSSTDQVLPASAAKLTPLKDLSLEPKKRIATNSPDFDRVLGGSDPGIVEGSVILLAGEPGIGKSTLLLQVASSIKGSLYFSAEESLEQIRLRSARLGLKQSLLPISAERRLPNIIQAIREQKPPFVVIDSVQTIYDDSIPGTPGSLVQVRENCWRLQQFAKNEGVAILLVGHVTKEGVIAGPKVLEHLVDVVLYLVGERQTGLRVLRAEKNRFGATDEVGIWQLESAGFAPVADPSRLFESILTQNVPGRALAATMEGSRAFIVEVQALAAKTAFGYPKRSAQGIDLGRLTLLAAVIENRLKVPVSQYDLYVNVVGGLNVKDPGVDLAVAAAIVSSVTGKLLPSRLVLSGEVGLLGEVRAPSHPGIRRKEVERLGYEFNHKLKAVSGILQLLDSKLAT